MNNRQMPQPGNIEDVLGQEIEANIKQLKIVSQALPVPSPVNRQMPPYLEHLPEVNDVGRLSSQALAAEYENAAKQVEAMGVQLIQALRGCEAEAIEAVKELEKVREYTMTAVKECEKTAANYREEAKEVFTRIQKAAILAKNVQQLCDEMTHHIVKGEPKTDTTK